MKHYLAIILLPVSIWCSAQDVRTVSGEYIYYPPDTESYEMAKTKALNRAQIQILADTYGTVINSSSTTLMSAKDAHTDVEMISVGESMVKGEWLETIGEPEYVRFIDGNDVMAIKVIVKGKVRPLNPSAIEYRAKILRNGTDERYESLDFKSGDDIYLSFAAPVDGYLAVYLFDGTDSAYCLLPYLSVCAGAYPVTGGRNYIFFSPEHTDSFVKPHDVDEFNMTCEKQIELNRIYCIFSPKPFAQSVDMKVSSETLPREMKYSDFQKWLSRLRIKDTEMNVKTFDITVRKTSL